MPGTEISFKYEIDNIYCCKNRVTKSNIRMATIKFMTSKRIKWKYYLICDTHHAVCTINYKHKSDALKDISKPWLWCDECAAIHFNTVWQLDPNVRRGIHTHRCNCFLEDNDE